MNKTWQLRVCALYLAVGLPLAASCAREANTLDDEEPSGSGGSSHTVAGNSAKAGTGSGNAGSSSAFGGTSSTAGKASGEGGDAMADGGAAPSAGTAGSGGVGGSTGVPPDVLERASAIVEYQ